MNLLPPSDEVLILKRRIEDLEAVEAALEEMLEKHKVALEATAKMYAEAVIVRDAALDALVLMQRALASTMPGVRHIAVQDYAVLNDAPLAAAAALKRGGR